MPTRTDRGEKSAYTDKQKRQAAPLTKSATKKKAKKMAWSAVSKATGGVKKKAARRTSRSLH